MEIFSSVLGFLKDSVGVLLFIISATCLSGSFGLWLYIKRQEDKVDKKLERIKEVGSSPHPLSWITGLSVAEATETSSIDSEQMENLTIAVYVALGVGMFTMLLALFLLLVL